MEQTRPLPRQQDRPDTGRRGFMGLMIAAVVAWVAAGLYPVLRYLAPRPAPDPFGEAGRAPIEKLSLADVANPGMGGNGGYAGRGLILFRSQEGELKAFDSKCTHAGCNVQYEGHRLFCQCHGGVYDLNGINVAGPPPKPLMPLKVIEEDGKLFVARMDQPA